MEKNIVIDGTNAIMGRLASYVAKQLLQGNKVVVVNTDHVIILGNRKDIIEKYSSLIKKGGSSMKGPKIIRTPERILKRTIRGMIPHKKGRRVVLDNIKCYNNIPSEYLDVKKIHSGKNKGGKFIELKELASLIK